jgi:Na+/melibiose symporter-like transporter
MSNPPVPAIVVQDVPSSPGAEDLEAFGEGGNDSLPLLGLDDDNDDDDDNSSLPAEHAWVRPRNFGLVQLALMANVFLYGLDGTVTAATYAVISSEFGATNMASWLTTSYLITSTAFQPLYGRLSDLFGRRVCFFLSTAAFAAGCLGCGLAADMVLLNCMRALAGFGGGGLMTMGRSSSSFPSPPGP